MAPILFLAALAAPAPLAPMELAPDALGKGWKASSLKRPAPGSAAHEAAALDSFEAVWMKGIHEVKVQAWLFRNPQELSEVDQGRSRTHPAWFPVSGHKADHHGVRSGVLGGVLRPSIPRSKVFAVGKVLFAVWVFPHTEIARHHPDLAKSTGSSTELAKAVDRAVSKLIEGAQKVNRAYSKT